MLKINPVALAVTAALFLPQTSQADSDLSAVERRLNQLEARLQKAERRADEAERRARLAEQRLAQTAPAAAIPATASDAHTPQTPPAIRQGSAQAPAVVAGPQPPVAPSPADQPQAVRPAEKTLAEGADYVEFMLHSSEFMPDGSPTFKTAADIDRLYDDLAQLFSWLQSRTHGMTLAEYAAAKAGT